MTRASKWLFWPSAAFAEMWHAPPNTREAGCACQMMATQVAKGEGNYLSQDERSKGVGLSFTS